MAGALPNNRMQATVGSVTARAKSARAAPAQRAPDAERWQRKLRVDLTSECPRTYQGS